MWWACMKCHGECYFWIMVRCAKNRERSCMQKWAYDRWAELAFIQPCHYNVVLERSSRSTTLTPGHLATLTTAIRQGPEGPQFSHYHLCQPSPGMHTFVYSIQTMCQLPALIHFSWHAGQSHPKTKTLTMLTCIHSQRRYQSQVAT